MSYRLRAIVAILFLAVLTLNMGFSALPASADPLPADEIKALKDWKNWVPDDGSKDSCDSGGASASDTTLTGKNNEEKTWNYFKSKGLSDQQAAGVLGNIANETGSTYDPTIVEGGGHSRTQPKTGGADGWGIVQWTYPYQTVSELYNQYKGKYNISGHLYELKTQLDIVWAQMNETSPTGVSNMVKGLKGINDTTQAATYFSDNFEGGVPGSRITDAIDVYGRYKGKGPDAATTGDTTGSGAGGTTNTATSDTLDGHKLPATVGGTGDESLFPSYALGSPANDNENNYYITMRWRYAKWNWDGTSVPGPEDVGWYMKHPKVLVTNPRTHKNIIAIALESGPAPWTGTAEGPDSKPSYWHNPEDGTPSEYDGRVSGFPPKAIQALGAAQWMNGKSGDKLRYAWAPDQNAKPGPTELVVGDTSSTGSGSCASEGTTGNGNNDDIVRIAKQELDSGIKGNGELDDHGPVCKYQGSSCGEAWCADFVSWVYKQAGKPFTGGVDGGWRLAIASDTTGYFLSRKGQNGIGYGTPSGGDKIEPGWVVSFPGLPDEQNARGIGHVGIVSAVNDNGTFNDIEGNGAGAGISENKNIPLSSAIDWGGYK